MAAADANGDGALGFHEFIAATLHGERLGGERNLRAAFQVCGNRVRGSHGWGGGLSRLEAPATLAPCPVSAC
jgi:hypothetical protein